MIDPAMNIFDSDNKLPYINKQHSHNLPNKRERNLNSLAKEKDAINKSAQESR
eukprot:CAMPEP_0168321194 /NCGR_PEP_ID=MMETSP0213-20121227/2124_1 /TAXON_ID=151035 /ORGANISM="Euplotes harpa, Strain FSP1.4" /LENGTH=52 /DNA_ID=CAMNT_0008322795 /DNA_START=262 /DNA_END=417 /DNA_ORIENTATION=-